jgi:hypothetical protein
MNDARGPNDSVSVMAAVLRQGNYDQAAALAEAAITKNNLQPRARKFAEGIRAAAALHTGHYDVAAQALEFIGRREPPRDIAAADTAIAAHPDRPEGYFVRAALALAGGQPTLASGDCDIAVGLEVAAIRSDGMDRAAWDNFSAGRFQQAIDDLGGNSTKVASQPYALLLLHVARAKLGRNDEQEMARAVDAAGLAEWPAPVLAFYLGRIDEEQLFTAAKEAPDDQTRVGQRCEANFYAGESRLMHSDTDGAKDLFETAARDCPIRFFEASAATTEIARLRQ